MAYEVKYDDGGYCCHFSHGKKKYYADLRDTYDQWIRYWAVGRDASYE